ncbi:GTP cyclohydrolase I FolE [Candidatus Protochlamydia phocaeensis]|uniref:GTP cyclohydrolase I FolE n=1 Tax=Candidatus Protochlamydia phocaeensis TaxID=1414722 RepID=UPI00083838A3|nr:GTP cyclohydrolase I FolE [Candidatus Protochlamydia phocaeensis]
MTKKTKAKQQKPANKKLSPAVTHFPSPIRKPTIALSNEEKIEIIASRFKDILEVLGLDLEDESIARTPYRVAKMYIEEVFSGLDEKNFPSISFFQDEFHHEHAANIVFVKVGFTSFCEHHFVPMEGYAYVSYVPGNKLIGLSKIPRIVRFFAKRPQLQERLTAQIADSLSLLLDTDDVAVSITARHHCVLARGIQDESSHTITNVLRGQFNTNPDLRREFFEGINRRDLS